MSISIITITITITIKFIMLELDNAGGGLREDCEEDLADVGWL